MFRTSLGSNSVEDHPEIHPNANPWLNTMDVDDNPSCPKSTANTLNPEADNRYQRRHPRDDSDDNPDSANPTAAKNPAEGWVQSKVRLQEVDHSQRLREELQQTKASLTQVSHQNEELAVRLPKS